MPQFKPITRLHNIIHVHCLKYVSNVNHVTILTISQNVNTCSHARAQKKNDLIYIYFYQWVNLFCIDLVASFPSNRNLRRNETSIFHYLEQLSLWINLWTTLHYWTLKNIFAILKCWKFCEIYLRNEKNIKTFFRDLTIRENILNPQET